MRAWRLAKKTQRMEVNHRVPCRGKHGTVSCDHHLDNLETLCVACHRVLTLADRNANLPRLDETQPVAAAVRTSRASNGECRAV
jgi:hypothetical protein